MEQEDLREKIYGNENHESHEVKSHMKNGAESAIILIAHGILIIGIIATIICASTTIFIDAPQIDYSRFGKATINTTKEFNPMGLILTLVVLFTTIMQWAFMKVVANISLNIKDINNKLK